MRHNKNINGNVIEGSYLRSNAQRDFTLNPTQSINPHQKQNDKEPSRLRASFPWASVRRFKEPHIGWF